MSHEFRTPLTAIRSQLEVDIAYPQTSDSTATNQLVLDETLRLQRLVDDLLTLVRLETTTLTTESVQLDQIIELHVNQLRKSTRIAIDVSGVTPVEVQGNADQLSRVVRNLLDNAIRHAHSVIRISLSNRNGQSELSIYNDGTPIPIESRSAIFERFTRLDDARNRDSGGSGLGLAISSEIIEAHGGSIRVEGVADATFVVRMPCSR